MAKKRRTWIIGTLVGLLLLGYGSWLYAHRNDMLVTIRVRGADSFTYEIKHQPQEWRLQPRPKPGQRPPDNRVHVTPNGDEWSQSFLLSEGVYTVYVVVETEHNRTLTCEVWQNTQQRSYAGGGGGRATCNARIIPKP